MRRPLLGGGLQRSVTLAFQHPRGRVFIPSPCRVYSVSWCQDQSNNHRRHCRLQQNTLLRTEMDTKYSDVASERRFSALPERAHGEEEEKLTNENQKVSTNPTSSMVDATLFTKTDFSNLENLHPATKRALSETLGLQYMTEIQAKTYSAASSGMDVLGRARTGTGKTLAFLLPAIERIMNNPNLHQPGKNVGVLIISPTRELATQIGDQAEKLLTFHKEAKVQVMFGGTNSKQDVSSLYRRIPSVLVATPGRLLDHMENTVLKGKMFGADVMRETPILVLDETDRLLDMGFRREIDKIMKYLPKKEHRQTLLFSATVPKELKQIMSENMRKDFVEADCIHDKAGQHTNAQVEQSHVVLPSMDRYVSSVVEIVQQAMNEDPDDHKIVVFFPTARVVGFFADFFNVGLGREVIEIHSKKSQSYRTKASDKFRKAKRGVLFTSDVSARGELVLHYCFFTSCASLAAKF
jgi:ATP-dependent RNA helicase MSS116